MNSFSSSNTYRHHCQIIRLIFVLFALLLTSCDTSPSLTSLQETHYTLPQDITDLTPINHPITTTGCGHPSPVTQGTSVNRTIVAHPALSEGHATRSYVLHVPSGYQNDQAYALILAFHGYSGLASGMDRSSGWTPLAEQQHFIVAYPQGLSRGEGQPSFWAEEGPIDFGIDDVLFVSDIISTLQRSLCINAHRIYATGISNGGGMTGLLACRLTGRIAAFAPMSANHYTLPGGCHPVRPVPLINFHGLQDTAIPYNGVPSNDYTPWPVISIPQWLQQWADRNGCTQGPTIFLRASNATGEQWSGCKGNATVVHYRFQGGHSFPPVIQGKSGVAITWQFFQAHPLI